ncbi:MAG: class I SAM-dependent methyltransferase [Deltaproteobacteria bacterium]|nr:class I SAM-dependent methyltransferase [Deltaproteobacteria bacterium]
MAQQTKLAAGSGSSVVVDRCQVCDYPDLEPIMFLGYLPPVNQMRPIGARPAEQPSYPAQVLLCPHCKLAQLGLIVDPKVLFPPEYPYTSGTTKILRDNFAQLFEEALGMFSLGPESLIVDIGSNDGTLLSNFQKGGYRVHGIEPTDMGHLAHSRGIPTSVAYFGREVAEKVRKQEGPAAIVTATNVFAHIENIHDIVLNILLMLDEKGVFISESHYLMSLLETVQYDTIYHEHLRYYSLHSLTRLLEMHGLEVFHARPIPTHGGSIRVYAARQGAHSIRPSVEEILGKEVATGTGTEVFAAFKRRVVQSKLGLYRLLAEVKEKGGRVYGVGAPSRASTLVNYVGIDDGILDCVLEIKGSYKIGKYMPGTVIPVEDEARLFEDPPDYAMLLSWHIADELMPKLAKRGYQGGFIVPLPEPRIVRKTS